VLNVRCEQRNVTIFLSKDHIEKDGSGLNITAIWSILSQSVSEIMTFIFDTWTDMHGVERLQCLL